MWHRKMTKQGSCIEFNPAIAARNYTKSLEATMVKDMSFELGDDQIKTMTILIGLNTSDFTYGKGSIFFTSINYIIVKIVTPEVLLQNPSKMEWVYEWINIILFPLYRYD